MSIDFINPKFLGCITPTYPEYKAPATPAKKVPTINARIFAFVTLTPIDSEAISSSLTDIHARPKEDFKILVITK